MRVSEAAESTEFRGQVAESDGKSQRNGRGAASEGVGGGGKRRCHPLVVVHNQAVYQKCLSRLLESCQIPLVSVLEGTVCERERVQNGCGAKRLCVSHVAGACRFGEMESDKQRTHACTHMQPSRPPCTHMQPSRPPHFTHQMHSHTQHTHTRTLAKTRTRATCVTACKHRRNAC